MPLTLPPQCLLVKQKAHCMAIKLRLTVAMEERDTATLRDVLAQLCDSDAAECLEAIAKTGLGETMQKLSEQVLPVEINQSAKAVCAYWKAAIPSRRWRYFSKYASSTEKAAAAAETAAKAECAFWKDTLISRKEATAAEGRQRGGGLPTEFFSNKFPDDALELVFKSMSPDDDARVGSRQSDVDRRVRLIARVRPVCKAFCGAAQQVLEKKGSEEAKAVERAKREAEAKRAAKAAAKARAEQEMARAERQRKEELVSAIRYMEEEATREAEAQAREKAYAEAMARAEAKARVRANIMKEAEDMMARDPEQAARLFSKLGTAPWAVELYRDFYDM